MKRNGREKDPVFAPTEKLFRRYKRDHLVGSHFSGVGLSFKNPPSVNRAKYSEAADVVFDEADEWENWGVLSFQVQDIPDAFPPDRPEYDLSPDHAPLENNYSHSQIHCNTARSSPRKYVEPRPQVRKLLRAAISQRITVEIEAQV